MPASRVFALVLSVSAVATSALAQALPDGGAAQPTAPAVWTAATGDVWLDTWLGDINTYAGRYRSAFIDELVRYQGAPRAFVTGLLDAGARPADVYLACAIGRALGRTCREIVAQWRLDPDAGWGEVLSALEAAPGSAPFAQVRRGLVSSFDRWARPIHLDAALRRAFPDRDG